MQDLVPARSDQSRGIGWISLRTIQISGCSLNAFGSIQRRRSAARGCSSVGRAVALQAIGQEFESPQLHHCGSIEPPRV